MQFPIVIELHRSTFLFLLLVLLHAMATACLMAMPWPLALRLVLVFPVGWSLARACRPARILGLRLSGKDRLDCLLADGNYVAAKVLADSAVYARLIVLRLRIGEERRVSSLTVSPDQLSVEHFRQLRLWLRWQAEPREDVGTAF